MRKKVYRHKWAVDKEEKMYSKSTFVAFSASSTRNFFSFSSVSVCAPICYRVNAKAFENSISIDHWNKPCI
jgi:hypothetical protein